MTKAQHLSDYLARNAKTHPQKLALVTVDKTLTWAELLDEVEARTAYFTELLGSDQQQVVGILMPNTWQYVVTYLAVVHGGHIALPIDVIFKPLEIEAIIHQIAPKLVVADKANHPRVHAHEIPSIIFEDIPETVPSAAGKLLRLPADKQIASLLFTSGTTGTPKATPYTHTNHVWNIWVCSQVWDWTHTTPYYCL